MIPRKRKVREEGVESEKSFFLSELLEEIFSVFFIICRPSFSSLFRSLARHALDFLLCQVNLVVAFYSLPPSPNSPVPWAPRTPAVAQLSSAQLDTRTHTMTTATTTTTQLVAAPISAEAFSPFGWVVQPRDDGDEFLPAIEPRLEGFEGGNGGGSGSGSGGGTSSSSSSSFPRLWVMRLPAARGRRFSDIARHDKVTQTLCGLGASLPWLLAVAPAGVERPAAADLVAFAVPPRVAVTLRKGTWHAGPLFDAPGRAEEGQGGISKQRGRRRRRRRRRGQGRRFFELGAERYEPERQDALFVYRGRWSRGGDRGAVATGVSKPAVCKKKKKNAKKVFSSFFPSPTTAKEFPKLGFAEEPWRQLSR